ncbi:MAG: nucleotidyl transferase AbiEii/AbiGii toxin family protein [Gemmatimonadetes bacterium]|nr:nucleotidyl transferase AbiEii/AbiGii toxin family protein [Gemmatimonadota bacterium]
MAPVEDRRPSLDRPAVSRHAAALAGPLGASCDLSGYRLAGGTALAWALGHRRSDDLDFFTRVPGFLHPIEQDRIASVLRQLDTTARIDVSQPQTIHAVVRDCKVSFFGLGGRWLSDAVQLTEGFGLATTEEIAAMKLIAVSTRSARKDFFDLHALASRGHSAEAMFSSLRSMYPNEIDVDVGLHVARALTDFSDAELDPDPVLLERVTWSEAKRSAQHLASDLQRYLRDLQRSGFGRRSVPD